MDQPRDYSALILIGPVRAGKTTLAERLSQRLGRPRAGLDDLRWEYYREAGYDDELARRLRVTGGFVALAFYWQLFDVYSVERVLAEHPGSIIDFGAGAGAPASRESFARLQTALAPYPYVGLVLPSPDPEESIRVLNERTRDLTGSFGQGFNWNEYFVRHPAPARLAKFVVYTHNRTPDESCADFLQAVGGQ